MAGSKFISAGVHALKGRSIPAQLQAADASARAGRYDDGMPTTIRDIIATSHYRQRFDRDRRRKLVSRKPAGQKGGETTFVFNDDGTFELAPTSSQGEVDEAPMT
jgi:hypothetical protein